MNEASPLVPQGSFEAQSKRKSHVRIAVFSILAVHVVVLGGLLILGCKPESHNKDAAENVAPALTNDLNPPPFGGGTEVVTTPPVTPGTPATPPPATAPAGQTPPPASLTTSVTPPPATDIPAAATEHKLASGESFATLSKKYGVSVKAIQDANPGKNPTRLQINEVVKIPAKGATVAKAVGAPDPGTGTEIGAGSSDIYKVKSNDTLGSIAKANKTTVKELQSLNNLKTTMIRVGQPLKLPTKSAPAAAPSASAELSVPAPATGNSIAVPVNQ